MATPSEIMQEAAGVFLNDTPRTLWTNAILLPFLKRAFKDLLLELDKKNISQTKEIAAPITVPALVVSLTTPVVLLPTNFITPVKIEERADGSSDLYTPMEEKDWEANIIQTERLRYWTYREDDIKFPGATTNRQILLYYQKGLTIPVDLDDPIGLTNVESFLSAQTAGYAAKFILQSDTRAEPIFGFATKALNDYLTIQVRGLQFQSNRRHRYLSKFRRRSHR
jgi:hypothetical protein